ncbi:MAG: hypothetical protein RRC07_16030 [Anaerolineae bacterium]|nr:hypothetical protein [Anaerolineae bacterium]
MNKRFALLLATVCAALTAALLFTSLARAGAPATSTVPVPATQAGEVSRPFEINSPLRISIPFGIAPILPLINEGRDVVVSGHGGCPLGETVTIAISISQPLYGAVATGETSQPCTDAEEQFQLIARSTISPGLTAGPAEACGTATMRLGDEIQEIQVWCRAEPALLIALDEQLYLPQIALNTAE